MSLVVEQHGFCTPEDPPFRIVGRGVDEIRQENRKQDMTWLKRDRGIRRRLPERGLLFRSGADGKD